MSTNTTNTAKNWLVEVPTKRYNRAEGFITVTRYNHSGSLLYIADNSSKKINVIDTKKWKIIGSYIGHKGVIWSLELTSNDNILVSGSGDLMLGIWGAKTGELFRMFEPLGYMSVPEKLSIQKNASTNYLVVYCKSKSKNKPSCINFYDLDKATNLEISDEEFKIKSIQWTEPTEITSIKWLNDTKYMIGTLDGRIIIKDFSDENFIQQNTVHSGAIKTLFFNRDQTVVLTSSIDGTAKEIDIATLEIQSEYKSPVQINSAIYNHDYRHIITGGGREAIDVAKSSVNDLSIKIFRKKDKKFVKEINSHFGPVRCLDIQPGSKNFVSGGHDGIAKIYLLDAVKEDEEKEEEKNEESSNIEFTINESSETFDVINSTKFLGIQNVVGKLLIDDKTNFELVNVLKQHVDRQNASLKQGNVPGSKNASSSKTESEDLFMVSNVDYLAETEERRKKRMIDDDVFMVNIKNNDADDDDNEFKPIQSLTPGAVKVTNLPMDADFGKLKSDLEKLFDGFGRISRIGIDSKVQNDRIAYINYTDVSMAIKAVDHYSKKENQYRFDYQVMCVELANQRR